MNLPHAARQAVVSQQRYDEAHTRLHGRWLLLARVIWVAIVVLAVGLFVASIPISYASVLPALPHSYLGLSAAFFDIYQEVLNVAFACCFFAVAGVLFWRKSDDRMALFASFTLVTFVIAFSPTLGALPQAWQVPVRLLGFLGSACLGVLFYLFPTGEFVPRWTRWFSLVVIVYWAQGSFFPDSPLARIPAFATLSAIGFIGSIVVAQVYRYRRVSSPLQRQQTKWVVFGTSVALLGFIGVELLNRLVALYVPPGLLSYLVASTVSDCFILLIPLSLGFAVLRYRLWDVDVLINKTLVYGLLTGTLVAMYVGCIVGLEALLQGLFHQTSDIAIVVSTLLIAALSQPLRKLIQVGIDRRFYRRKYDAARILAAFSATLRSEVDLSKMREDLAAVVQETMQPAHISLWLPPLAPSRQRNTRMLPQIDERE
jgi:hypothetical protein